MSTELTPLEALKEIKEKYISDNGLQRRLTIIEMTLKALEIIKETIPIKEEDFFYDEETDTYFFIGYEVSKNQYDLLKEVLLWIMV